MQLIKNIVDFFIPRFCISCDTKLEETELFICSSCISKLVRAPDKLLAEEYNRKFKNNVSIKDFHSHLVFKRDSEIQTIIHSLKYSQKFLVGKILGELVARNAIEKITSWECDGIIPIPLHKLKKTKRGYNQAYYISKGISDVLGIPVISREIKRVKFTQTQTKLNANERENNVNNAFRIGRNKHIQNKNLILVDDVITTGATIKECARILKENGAKNIYAISVALADHDKVTTSGQEH